MCGVNFGDKWGKSARNNVRNIAIPVKTNSGSSAMKMRICRSHELTEDDKRWLVECHKLYFIQNKQDVHGQDIGTESIEGWQYDSGEKTEEEVYANE